MVRTSVDIASDPFGFDRDDRMYCACQTGLHEEASEYPSLIESVALCFPATETQSFATQPHKTRASNPRDIPR